MSMINSHTQYGVFDTSDLDEGILLFWGSHSECEDFYVDNLDDYYSLEIRKVSDNEIESVQII